MWCRRTRRRHPARTSAFPRMLVLVSKTRATDKGRFVSLLKFDMVWDLSSSKTLKSSFGSLVMSFPLLSATVNNDIHEIDVNRQYLRNCCRAGGPGSAGFILLRGQGTAIPEAQRKPETTGRSRIRFMERFMNYHRLFPSRRQKKLCVYGRWLPEYSRANWHS